MGDRYKYRGNGSSYQDFDRSHVRGSNFQPEPSWNRNPSFNTNYDTQAPPQRYQYDSNPYREDIELKRDYSQNKTDYYSRNREPSHNTYNYPDKYYEDDERNNSYYCQKYERDSRGTSDYPPGYEKGRDDTNIFGKQEERQKMETNYTEYGQERNYSDKQRTRPQQQYESDGYQKFRQEKQPEPYSRRDWQANNTGHGKSNMNYSQFYSANERSNAQTYASSNFRSEEKDFDNSSFYSENIRRTSNSFIDQHHDRYNRNIEPYSQLRHNVNLPPYESDNNCYSLDRSHLDSQYRSPVAPYFNCDVQQPELDMNGPRFGPNQGQQHKGKFKRKPGKKGKKKLKDKMKSQKQKKKGKKIKRGGMKMKKKGTGPSVQDKKQENENNTNENNKRPRSSMMPDDDDFFTETIEQDIKKIKFEKVTTPEEQVNHVRARATPLHNLAYHKQVSSKNKAGKNLVLNVCEQMAAVNPHVKKWFEEQKKINEGLPCKIHDIVYKEKDYDYYKNRIELLVGLDSLTNRPCVGMRCGIGGIAPLEGDLKTIPKIILPEIRTFEKFLNQSQMGVSQANSPNDCVWKHLSFKVGFKTNQILMMVGFQVSKLNDERILKAQNELNNFYKSAGHGVTSLFLQIIRDRDKNGPSIHAKHLLGEQWIEEIIDGVKFKIKPQSDIPNCQWGAELTNQTVRKLGQLNKNTMFIDVGSPLGTVSLCVAKDCKRCHYIEPKFIRIPSKNAKNIFMNIPQENNITNWTQSHAKVEFILPSVVKKLKLKEEPDALIYFDPWCSIRKKGISVVNNTKEINRLLFLTCGKKLMLDNFVELVKEILPAEDTYVPVEAVPIDTYPHTPHMAVFILLERIKVARTRKLDDEKNQSTSPDSDGNNKNTETSNFNPEENSLVEAGKTDNTTEKNDSEKMPLSSSENSGDIKTEANLRGSTEIQAEKNQSISPDSDVNNDSNNINTETSNANTEDNSTVEASKTDTTDKNESGKMPPSSSENSDDIKTEAN